MAKRYLVWLEQAEYDLQAAHLSMQNGYYEWAAFQAQQSAEKSLKAYLIHCGWRSPRVHKLSILLRMCQHANENFRIKLYDVTTLEALTFASRYPFVVPGEKAAPHHYIIKEDAEECINEARVIHSSMQQLNSV